VRQNHVFWPWAAFILCTITFCASANAAGLPPLVSRALAAGPAPAIVVELDKAKLVGLPQGSRRIVVGNPLIVRATQLHDGIVVLTGTAYGETNIVVFDDKEVIVMESVVRIEPSSGSIIVQRGAERSSYDCEPGCEGGNQLGDTGSDSEKMGAEVQARDAAATGQAAMSPAGGSSSQPGQPGQPQGVNPTASTKGTL
jgi:hypothetical protein